MMKQFFEVLGVMSIIFYVGGSLAGRSFNPFAWSDGYRETVAIFWIVFVLIGMIFSHIAKKEGRP
jgi:hypothetical protein